MVYIGAEVLPGDILVGKVTPKGEIADDAGRKASAGDLRREGFGRARYFPAGAPGRRRYGGRGACVFSRRGVDKDERALAIERSKR